MPPTPIPDGYGIATHKYTLAGRADPFVVTHGFVIDPAKSADQMAAALKTAWIGAFTAATSLTAYTYNGCHVLLNNGGALMDGDSIVSVTGTVSADPVSPAVAAIVRKKSGLAGRKHRGRMYLPPALLPDANVNSAGLIDSGTLGNLQTHSDAYLNALSALSAPMPMVLLHADSSTPDVVIAVQAEEMVGTQRRRQR